MRYLSRRTAIESAIAAALAFVMSLIVFGPVLRYLDSGWSGGDMLSTYVNTVNWGGFGYRTTTQFGYPLGMNLNYFPNTDITENWFASAVNALTGSPFLGINLLVILSFPLVAALAYLTIRITGLRGPVAIALAVAFSVIPYHWGRALGHTYLSTLYSAVIGVALVLLIGSGAMERMLRERGRRRTWLIAALVAMVAVIAWTGIYYAVFTVILGAAALLWRWAHRATMRRLLVDALPLIGIGVLSIVGFLPGLLTTRADPPLAALSERAAFDSVIFAGNLAMALLPIPQSSLPGFSAYNDTILAAFAAAPYGENHLITNYGTWISSLAAIVFLIGAAIATRRRPRSRAKTGITLGLVGTLIVTTLLFFVPWGLNYLFADFVTAQIRGWNRLLPMLLLLFILGAAVVLRERPLARRIVPATLVALLILGLTAIDSVLPFRGAYRDSAEAAGEATQAARDYAQAVNTAIPQNCGVLQLPYMPYPEFGLVHGINDYDHFWTSITNPGKSWSYGAVKNTDASVWMAQLPQVPNDDQVELLRKAGFCGIHLDTRGYIAEMVPGIQQHLADRFGAPIATAFDGKWEFYRIGGATKASDDPAVRAFLHQPLITADEQTTTPMESSLDHWWWWTEDRRATLDLQQTSAKESVSQASGQIASPDCGPVAVVVTLESNGSADSAAGIAKPGQPLPFDLKLDGPAERATLTVAADGQGCQVAGAKSTRFAQILDLKAR